MTKEYGNNVLAFLHEAEQLKQELRHSWTSDGRQESVAEHSWRLAIMLVACAPYLGKGLDLLKAIKMALFHDLGEAIIGDMHYLDIADNPAGRFVLEEKAMRDLTAMLPSNGKSLLDLWKEFESKSSFEARVVFFLDKLEACIQHNEAGIETWTQKEIDAIQEYFNSLQIENEFLMNLKQCVMRETKRKFIGKKI